jgi:hypothetical protein
MFPDLVVTKNLFKFQVGFLPMAGDIKRQYKNYIGWDNKHAMEKPVYNPNPSGTNRSVFLVLSRSYSTTGIIL